MARTPPSAQLRHANLTATQMREAIPRIERRIAEVEQFDPSAVRNGSDPIISVLEKRLQTLLDGIFGDGTIEHKRFSYEATTIDRTHSYLELSIHEIRAELAQGKSAVLSHLNEILVWFREELNDSGATPVGQTLRAYDNLELHPEIERAAGKLFRNEHYASAIEDAVKALNALVRLRSGEDAKDGVSLMEFVFSPKNPVLKFNALADPSDFEEQKGFMMMFSGAVAGLRNPRAHKIIKDDPESALEFIAFISLLAKLVDRAEK